MGKSSVSKQYIIPLLLFEVITGKLLMIIINQEEICFNFFMVGLDDGYKPESEIFIAVAFFYKSTVIEFYN